MSNRLSLKFKIRIIVYYSLITLLLSALVGLLLAYVFLVTTYIDNEAFKVVLATTGPALYSIFIAMTFLSYRPHKSHGIPVTKATAPKLFALIEDVANKVKFKNKLEEVVLTPGISVSVNYEPSLFNLLFDAKAKLHIGISACHELATDELAAVIAHELAHFSQPMTKYKAYIARLANISSRLGKNLHIGSSICLHGLYFTWPMAAINYIFRCLFDAIFDINSEDYRKITTDMELEADKISAQSISASNLLSALCKSYAISHRLVLYKYVILPYLSSIGYRCDGYWRTFERSYPLFRKIDSLDIRTDKPLLDLVQNNFEEPESLFALRLKSLQQISDSEISSSTKESAIDVIPTAIQNKLDAFLCRKYGQNSGIPVGSVRMSEIIESLSNGMFADVHSMQKAFLLLVDLLSESREYGQSAPTFKPENVSPSINIYVIDAIVKQPSDEIYSSPIDKCPVCGMKISKETKICPHCHETIAE